MNWKIFIAVVLVVGALSCVRDSGDFNRTNVENDSLDYFFKIAYDDHLPYATRYKNNRKALKIISRQTNDSLNRVNYFKVANRFWNMRAFTEFKKTTHVCIKKAIKAKDTIKLAKAYSYLSDTFKLDSDSAYYYNYLSEKLYSKLKDTTHLVDELINKSVLQYNTYDFIGSENTLFKAVKYLDLEKDGEQLYRCYLIMGAVNDNLKDYTQSIDFYNKALLYSKKVRDTSKSHFYCFAMNNIGIAYANNNQHDVAIPYFKKALNDKDLYAEYPATYRYIQNNLIYSNFKIGNNSFLPQRFIADREYFQNLPTKFSYLSATLRLSEYYLSRRNLFESLNIAKDGLKTAKQKKDFKYILLFLKQLVNSDTKNSSKYSQEYYELNDSLGIAERRNRNKFARIEYETEELAYEKNQLIEQKHNYILTVTIIFLIIITTSLLGFLIFKRRQINLKRQKQKTATEIYRLQLEQEQKIEEGKQFEKKRIAQELHDGVMGKLASIRLNLFVLNKKSDAATIDKCLEYIDGIQGIEKEIRAIAYELHNDVSEDLNTETL